MNITIEFLQFYFCDEFFLFLPLILVIIFCLIIILFSKLIIELKGS